MVSYDKKMIKLGMLYIIGFIFGIGAFIFLGEKSTLFSSMLSNLKEWNMIGLMDLFEKYKLPFIIISLVVFAIFIICILGFAFINDKKDRNKRETVPWFLLLGVGVIIGLLLVPFIIMILSIILIVIYAVWFIALLINLFIFKYVCYGAFVIIDFILKKVLVQDVALTSFNEESQFMFFQTILFFTIIPYIFRGFIIVIEKLFYKTCGNISSLLIRPLKILNINFFRYITYVFAFFTYMLTYLWTVPKNINAIKEGLLAFIIIDIVVYGIYSDKVKNRKKNIDLVLISLSRELERIQNEIVIYNLFEYYNCNVSIKSSIFTEELGNIVEKKALNDKLKNIYENIKKISYSSTKEHLHNKLTFKDLFIEIDKIQKLIHLYVKG